MDFLKICRAGRGRNLSEWKVKSFLKSAARSEPVEPAEPAEPHVGGFTDRFASEVFLKHVYRQGSGNHPRPSF